MSRCGSSALVHFVGGEGDAELAEGDEFGVVEPPDQGELLDGDQAIAANDGGGENRGCEGVRVMQRSVRGGIGRSGILMAVESDWDSAHSGFLSVFSEASMAGGMR